MTLPNGRIRVVVNGASGKSFADIARSTGVFGVQPDDTDQEALEKFAILGQTIGGRLNMFDKNAVQVGYEVQFSGALVAESNSVASDAIYVGDATQITFSGLSPNVDIGAGNNPGRVYAFYSAYPTSTTNFVSYGQLGTGTTTTVTVPNGAKYMRFSPKQRDSGSVPYDNVQVQVGGVATAFQSYQAAVIDFNGKPVGRAVSLPVVSVGKVAIFGDSITETQNVDDGQYVYGTGNTRQNWPDVALTFLYPTAAYNFARSEASFANRASTVQMQKFDGQITAAFGVSGFTPNVVIVALGINDLRFLGSSLGDYNVAVGKSYSSLDLTVPVEAMRHGFYRLQQQWPNAVKFVSLPLQAIDNAQLQFDNIRNWADTIAKMASRYGFTVIDAFNESGIVREFENNAAPGVDLVDGLHTGLPGNEGNASGRNKQGRLIASRVRNRLAT